MDFQRIIPQSHKNRKVPRGRAMVIVYFDRALFYKNEKREREGRGGEEKGEQTSIEHNCNRGFIAKEAFDRRNSAVIVEYPKI